MFICVILIEAILCTLFHSPSPCTVTFRLIMTVVWITLTENESILSIPQVIKFSAHLVPLSSPNGSYNPSYKCPDQGNYIEKLIVLIFNQLGLYLDGHKVTWQMFSTGVIHQSVTSGLGSLIYRACRMNGKWG